jgi:4'-phosphopantetheinyl transferase
MLPPIAEIHVWTARLDAAPWPPASKLPRGERERAERQLRAEKRRRWVASRWALRGVLAGYLGEDPAGIELRTGGGGKPELAPAGRRLRFNLSHSADLALVTVARGQEVGVDVERIEPRRDVLALARRALGPAATAALARAPARARPAAFHAAWTRHEATAKCLGAGVGMPLPHGAVTVADLDAGSGFAAALAVSGGRVPSLRRFAIEPAALELAQ